MPTPALTPPAEYNREILEALAENLRREFSDAPAYVDLIWFADDMEGLPWFADFSPPPSAAADVPDCTSDNMQDSLSGLTYSPGLDVWDHLETALEIVVNKLSGLDPDRTAVLIVGNSPPNPPLDDRSPFWNLLRLDNGIPRRPDADQPYTSTYRRGRRSNYHDWVDRIQAGRLPIAYLFLKHTSCLPAHRAEFDMFQQMQECVVAAFQQSIHVEAVQADRTGIAVGLSKILEVLASAAGEFDEDSTMSETHRLSEAWSSRYIELQRRPEAFAAWLSREIAAAEGAIAPPQLAAALRSLTMYEFSAAERVALLAELKSQMAAQLDFDLSSQPQLTALAEEEQRLQECLARRCRSRGSNALAPSPRRVARDGGD
ncbi:MAG: hypothetical protein QM775_24465 [Pirellulales bacterium]